MSTKTEKLLELIYKLLENLRKLSSQGIPIVVEGKKDLRALNRLGITTQVILAKTSGKSFLDVLAEIEQKNKREVILLFDFDRRGRELTKRLASYLEGLKITPNLVFWKKLFCLVKRDVKDIEGLETYLSTLKNKSSMS